MKIKLMIAILCLNCILGNGSFAAALREGQAFRDAEIERVLKNFITPLFKTAGLNPEKLNLILVSSDTVNAAATLDNTIVINSGLILAADSADEVIGVLAHETAHIADGHIVRTVGAMENASIQSLIGIILGGLLAAATGDPGAAVALSMGGSSVAERMFLYHSRGHEGSADQGALRYLDSLGWPSLGLLTFMEKLAHGEIGFRRDDIYMRSHPLTRERIQAFKHHLTQSQQMRKHLPQKFESDFQRIKAKIEAFARNPSRYLHKYQGNAPLDRYIRAVAHYRTSDFRDALGEIDALVAEFPNDPDYWDLKGQILFESGQVRSAITAYGKAVKLDPHSPLLREVWAQAMIESEDESLLAQAEQELLRAAADDPYSPLAWHLLAVAFGRQDKLGLSSLALAEQSLLQGRFKEAGKQARRAKYYLDPEDTHVLRADDIMNEVKRIEKLRS